MSQAEAAKGFVSRAGLALATLPEIAWRKYSPGKLEVQPGEEKGGEIGIISGWECFFAIRNK